MSKRDLTAEQLRQRINYDPETGVFTQKVRTTSRVKVGKGWGSPIRNGYLIITLSDRNYPAHHLA